MKALGLFTAGLMFMSFLFFAHGEEPPADNSHPADYSHSALESVLPAHCIFSGNFEHQKTISGINKPLLSLGQIFFSCHHGLIWQTQQPFNESVIYTKKNLHFRSTEYSEFKPLEGPQHEFIATLLINLMSGDAQAIASDFAVQTGPASEKKEAIDKIVLTPKTSYLKKAIERILIDKESAKFVNIELIDNLGQKTSIKLSNMKELSGGSKNSATQYCLQSLPNSTTVCEILSEPEWQSIRDTDF